MGMRFAMVWIFANLGKCEFKRFAISWQSGTFCNIYLRNFRRIKHLFWKCRLSVCLWDVYKLVITHAYSYCNNKSDDADATGVVYHVTPSYRSKIFTYKAYLLWSLFILAISGWNRCSLCMILYLPSLPTAFLCSRCGMFLRLLLLLLSELRHL